jgi:hypothetical protein
MISARQASFFLKCGNLSEHSISRFVRQIYGTLDGRVAGSHIRLDLTSKRMLEIMHALMRGLGISVPPSIWSAHNAIRVEARCSQLESSAVIRA